MILAPKDQFLVRCPRCEKCAQFSRTSSFKDLDQANRLGKIDTAGRITCTFCGYSEKVKKLMVPEELYLQVKIPGGVLFAFDGDHLEVLERFFIAGEQRIEAYPVEYRKGLRRLGKPLLLKKNRDKVIEALKILRKKL